MLFTYSAGCGDSPDPADSTTATAPSANTTTTDIASTAEVVFHSASGDSMLKVEVARSDAERSRGLMNRTSLDPGSGMIFVWEKPVTTPFWMKDTLIPLSIAFIAGDGTIIDIQEMQAESLAMHAPGKSYLYAVEANEGYFTRRGIKFGDIAEIKL